MTDDRVLDYLRSRGQAEVPANLVGSVMIAIDDPVPTRSGFAAWMPTAAIAAVVAVVAVALLIGPGPKVGPGPSPATSSATASVATVDEAQAALTNAVDVLRSADGVEGIGTYHVLDELGSVSWFSWRPNGDQVVVNRTDVDVTETGWWRDPEGGPPARGVNVQTGMQVLAGSGYFFTRADDPDGLWVTGLREGSPQILGVPFPAALDGRMEPWQSDIAWSLQGRAWVRRLADGGETWTLTRPVRTGSLVQEFDIGPDGALRSVSYDLVGTEPALDERPITSARIELTVLQDPAPIPQPDADAPADPAALGYPADLPLDPAP